MWLFYIAITVFTIMIAYTLYENYRSNLLTEIYNKQLEFASPEIEFKNKRFGKYGVAASLIATLVITPFAFTSETCGDSVYCFNDELFQVVEVSAGEYIVNSYGEGFSFGINVFKDNESILLLDNKYPYYEGFSRFHTVNELVDLVSYNIDGEIYTHVTIDGELENFIKIEMDDHSTETRIFDFKFKDFENDVVMLNQLLREYPPRVVRKYYEENDYHDREKINPNYEEIEDEYYRSLYKSYFEAVLSSSYSAEPEEMRRIEVNYHLKLDTEENETVSRMGLSFYGIDKVVSKQQIEEMQYDPIFSNNPFWTLDNDGWMATGTSYNEMNDYVQRFPGKAYVNQDKDDEKSDIYSTIIIDLSELDGEEPEISVSGTVKGAVTYDVPTDEGWAYMEEEYSNTFEVTDYYIMDHLLVIPPLKVVTVYRDGNLDVMVDYDVTIIINGEEVKINSGNGFNVYWNE